MDINDEESLPVCTFDICLSFFFALQFQTGESLIKEENMAETMTNEEVYDFIGELAIALYSKKIRISLGALRVILADKGRDYNNNRGMATGVSAAYRRWKDKDPVVYHAIAYTYTDKDGNLAWDKGSGEVPTR